ncbi:D-2-hydroxyglutarate dehydrogenase, mitochondrial [Toxocara canis]|uniref:D-2-hydroxyglutarate dehydrogenase, mitochondrial n=1 Tax=Toxocara canis TaxID=6265 RepID=A0A0B2VB82_TOXCA|nr:D-2-hydroxyglutarate dehydrogenase, mitochondrial [Toxocara canis]
MRATRRVSTVVPPRRGPYAELNDGDIAQFERILGSKNVLTSDLDPYNVDWMKWFKGSSSCVLFPTSAEEVSKVLGHCFSRRLAVVPQSGNTGLVGGSIPVYDEVVLSLRKLNSHYQFESQSGVLECDSGFILEELDNRLASEGYMVPLDLGAKGSCLIGGNISTGAGGLRLIRFGSLHNHLLGLQVVSLSSFEKCREIVRLSKDRLGEVLSALEIIDEESMCCVLEDASFHKIFSSDHPFYILLETIGSDEYHDQEKLANFLNEAMDRGLLADGVQACSREEASYMWRIREAVPVALVRSGYVFKHDVSLPLQHFYTLTEAVKHRLAMEGLKARVFTFGHIGDGNSHLNVVTKEYSPDVADELYPFIYDWVVTHDGSISAEHGIGQLKKPFMAFGKGVEIEIAKRLKKVFDPSHILSPYKMF